METKKIKVITYHISKSTSVGGIQRLVRHIQNLELGHNFDFIEAYNDVPNMEINGDNPKVEYNKIFSGQKSKNPLTKIWERIAVYCYFVKKKYRGGIILVFHPEHLALIPRSTLRKNKIILVQANRFDKLFERIGKLAFELNKEHVDFFSVYTEYDLNFIKEHYPSLVNKTRVIPRGCRIPTGAIKSKMTYKLVTICRIYERQKNLTSMLNIVNGLPDEYTLDIYGIGAKHEMDSLLTMIDSKKVKFKGEAKDVAAILEDYSVFLMTSHYEGFGQTLIEARSQGLPIVAYNTFDALTWIVQDGVNGKVVPYKDENAFSNAIQQILSDESIYLEYSKNSIDMAKSTELSRVSEQLKNMIISAAELD
ncbi:glycosyltransferase [Gayadomonas joobiniege]|uniref:glycosyltransferase n=1 Tax=Gayadomonas joobiniege TaxID=1234606 RepID=UPI0003614ED5|nr:glycosyltransferase [Gayadomonas joobiniege]